MCQADAVVRSLRAIVVLILGSTFVACSSSSSSETTTTSSLPVLVELAPPEPPERVVLAPETSTTSTTTEAPRPDGVAVLAFTGDTLVHSPLWSAARRYGGGNGYDFGPMFDEVAPIISAADLAVCHLETLFAPPGVAYSTMPRYQVPEEVASALVAAGYDRCSTASNHVMDGGTASIDHTLDVFDELGLGQHGIARTPEEIEPSTFVVNGIVMSHLSYTVHFNGLSLPADEPWRSARIDIDRIVEDATKARSLGAEFVMVSVHWGNEGSNRPNPDQKKWSERMAASGVIDLVIGSHPHLLQSIDKFGDLWVVNSLGNFLSNMPTGDRWAPGTQDGAIVEFTVSRTDNGFDVSEPRVHPTWVDRDDGFVIRALGPQRDELTGEMAVSWRRTSAVLGEFLAPAGDV